MSSEKVSETGDQAADIQRRKSKRSQTVSLVLVAGAGAAALALGRIDPSQREEDVLVYPNSDACIAAHIRTESDCVSEYQAALAAYPNVAPRYDTVLDCESHHGAGHCVDGATVTEGARGRFLPIMAAYVIGRTAAQALPPQPLFDHRPEQAAAAVGVHGGYGGYCTAWGGRVWTSSGGRATTARVSSASVRTAAFGGLGSTGRAYSSSSSSSSRGLFSSSSRSSFGGG